MLVSVSTLDRGSEQKACNALYVYINIHYEGLCFFFDKLIKMCTMAGDVRKYVFLILISFQYIHNIC